MLRTALVALLVSCAAWSWTADVPKSDPPKSDPAKAADAKADAASAATVTDPTKVTVVVTGSGTKYHTKDCPSAKKGTEETLAKALSDGLTPCATCHPPVYDPTTIVVYDGGPKSKKYHTKTCSFAKNETTLAKAEENGLEPCKVCGPPPLPVAAPLAKPDAPAKDGAVKPDAPVKDGAEKPKKSDPNQPDTK